MMEILVKDLISGGERKFCFNRWNCDDFDTVEKEGLPLHLLRERCLVMFNYNAKSHIKFLCGGQFYNSEKDRLIIQSPTNSAMRTLYLIPIYSTDVERESLFLDAVSYGDAIEWLLSDSSVLMSSNFSTTAQLTLALQECVKDGNSNTETEGGEAEAQQLPQVTPPAAQPPQNLGERFGFQAIMERVRLIRIGLIIRMAVFYFIFCHNRGGGLENRRSTILGVMVVVYFLQVGLFSFLYQRLLQSLRLRVNDAHEQQGNVEVRPVAYVRRVLELFEHGVVIPRTAGIFFDILSLLIGIVGSLFPAWNPYQPPPRVQAQQPPPGVAQPNRVEQNEQQNN